MEKKLLCRHRRLRSAVSRPGPALEATRPPQSSARPARSPWRLNMDTLGEKPRRLTDTQRRRLRRKRARERDALRQAGALQALDSATRALVLNNLKAPRGRPDGPNDREPQWTNIPRSGDPSGGAAPSGGCLPDSTTGQRSSSRAERFKQFSSK